jgi:hypothetical protein
MFCFKAGVLLEELRLFTLKYTKNQKLVLGKQQQWEFRFSVIDGYSFHQH